MKLPGIRRFIKVSSYIIIIIIMLTTFITNPITNSFCRNHSHQAIHLCNSTTRRLSNNNNKRDSKSSTNFKMSASSTTEKPSILIAMRAFDKPDSLQVRMKTRPAHLEWCVDTNNNDDESTPPKPNIFLGGPKLIVEQDNKIEGSLLLLHPHKHLTDKILPTDPYAINGLFDTSKRQLFAWKFGMGDVPLPVDPNNPLFMIWCVDLPGQLELRMKTRPNHLEWWKNSNRKGIIGPLLNDIHDVQNAKPCGTLIICQGSDLNDVQRWAETDPYAVAGLFETVHIRLFKKVIEQGNLIS